MTTPVPFLDLSRAHHDMRAELDAAWRRVVDGGRFVGGDQVAGFEAEFARFCEAPHALGVGNGTDALEIILAALGIGPSDEVLVPANTFVATAEAVCRVGATPRFVDVRPDTLLLDPDAAAAAVGPATAAIIAVHLFGQMCDVDRLGEVARRHGLALIEDAAQAHGARFAGRRAGGVGVAAAFSFYPGKNLGALGDGGAVTCGDAALLDRMRQLADHGRSVADRHHHDVVGRNSRLDAVQAAVLRVKLARLDEANALRDEAMAQYRSELPDTAAPVHLDPRAAAVHHLAVVQVSDRDRVTATLDAAGIGWGLHYPVPCHRQPAFARFADGPLPVAEDAARRILSLPMFPGLTKAEVRRVCETVEAVP